MAGPPGRRAGIRPSLVLNHHVRRSPIWPPTVGFQPETHTLIGEHSAAILLPAFALDQTVDCEVVDDPLARPTSRFLPGWGV